MLIAMKGNSIPHARPCMFARTKILQLSQYLMDNCVQIKSSSITVMGSFYVSSSPDRLQETSTVPDRYF
jgi:hypothetical protein